MFHLTFENLICISSKNVSILMDEKVFQEEWIRIKRIGELTIYHCRKKYEEIYKEYKEFCSETKWSHLCDLTTFLSGNEWSKICKNTQRMFEDEAPWLILEVGGEWPLGRFSRWISYLDINQKEIW